MKRSSSAINLCGLLLSLFCLISMYIFPGIVKHSAFEAVILCGRSVIPSLFPYIVLTRIVIHLSIKASRKKSGNFFEKWKSILFYTLLFAGLISGAPTGAVLAGQMYSQGIIHKSEAEKIAVFSCIASPAFCINYFGADIVGRRSIGFILYLALVTVNLLMFAVYNALYGNTKDNEIEIRLSEDDKNGLISEIIYDSCMTILGICACVTFFMCTGNVLYTVISFISGENPLFKVFFTGGAEMTAGVSATKALPIAKKILCSSAVIGFSGLSVMLQTTSVCTKYGFGCRRLLTTKLISAFAVPAVMFVFTVLAECSFFSVRNCVISVIVLSIFAFLTYFVRKYMKKYKKSKVYL